MGKVQDIANAALYLGSDCGHYVSGTNLVVDGGQYLTFPNMMFAIPEFVQRWQ